MQAYYKGMTNRLHHAGLHGPGFFNKVIKECGDVFCTEFYKYSANKNICGYNE